MRIITKINQSFIHGDFLPQSVKKSIVMRGENLIKSYFRDGGNFQEKWKPVKRGGQPLIDTGRLRDNVVGQVVGGQMQIINKLDYASRHNFGYGVTKREFMILPDGWATKVAIEEMLDYSDWINKK